MNSFDHATPAIIVLLIGLILPVLYYIRAAKKGAQLYVRRIAGIDAVDEAIGRSAELGRPVSFSTGLTVVGPVLYACLGVLHYVARKIALYKTRLLLPQNDPEVMAFTEDVVRDAYREAGRAGSFDPQSIIFLSAQQFAFAAGYQGLIHREQAASAFLFGSFAAESLILAEAGRQVGAMQVAASTSPEQIPFFIVSSDYTLIGEELFAAAAYLTHEPVQLGSLCGQDRSKLIFLGMILIGVLIATINVILEHFGIGTTLPNIDRLFELGWQDLFGKLASSE